MKKYRIVKRENRGLTHNRPERDGAREYFLEGGKGGIKYGWYL